MSKKAKSPVRRDEDFEELDLELEAAMRALESVNERTAGVLQRVEQGGDTLDEAPGDGAEKAAGDAGAAPAPEPETPAEG